MANTDVNDPKTDVEPKRAVAKHALIDVQGQEVDSEETATGVRYTVLANGEAFEYQYAPDDAGRMLALFGAKTLATNESSQVRNSPKGAGTPAEQIGAVRERFALIATGQWIDRTREPGVTGVDKEALARAVVAVVETDGQTADYAKVLAKIEGDKAYRTMVRSHPPVAAKYAEIVGKGIKTTSDLLAGL
jgi:hypothetical protein